MKHDFLATLRWSPRNSPLGGWVSTLSMVRPPSGPATVFTLLHEARLVLLSLSGLDRRDIGGWEDRVKLVDAVCEGTWNCLSSTSRRRS